VIQIRAPSTVYSLIFYSLSGFLIAVSVSSSIFAYKRLNSYESLILFIVTYCLICCTLHKILPDPRLTYKDALFSVIALIPILVTRLFSPLPLGDDIRYIGASLFRPNGFISLVGYSVVFLDSILHMGIITAYWLMVFATLYLFSQVLVVLYREKLRIRGSLAYVATWLTLYIPNLATLMLLPKLFIDPYSINRIIFDEWHFHYLGRIINIDPNLLKNVAVVLPLLTILINNSSKPGKIFTSLLFILAYLYHPLNSLTAIIIAVFYKFILGDNQSHKMRDFIETLGYLIFMYFIVWFAYGGSYVAFLFRGEMPTYVNVIINVIILLAIISSSYIIAKVAEVICKREYLPVMVIILPLIPGLLSYKVSIEPTINRLIDLRAPIIYGYYALVLITLYATKYLTTHERMRILKMALLPATVILLVPLLQNLVKTILLNIRITEIDVNRYIQVIARTIITPAMGISIMAPSLFALSKLNQSNVLMKARLMNAALAFLLSVSIVATVFFIAYWGFYYRNPWAVTGFDASYSNTIFYVLDKLELNVTPYIHSFPFSTYVVAVRDILGLRTGIQLYSPATINDPSIPDYLRNIVSFVPDIVVTDSKNDILHDILSPISEIRLGAEEVRIYRISSTDKSTLLASIVSPIPDPLLSPELYKDLIVLQKYFEGEIKIIISPDIRKVNSLGMPLIGEVILVGEQSLENNTFNLSKLYMDGYNYIIFIPKEKTIHMTVECLDNNRKTITRQIVNIYPPYISREFPYIISIERFTKILSRGCQFVRILDAKEIRVAKTYYVNLYLRKNNPGSMFIVHTYDYSFNGYSSFIEVSNSSILYYENNASIISLFHVDYKVPRREYIIYSEGTECGTVFHISRIRDNDIFVIKGYEWHGCGVRSSYSYSYVFGVKQEEHIRFYSGNINTCSETINTTNKPIVYSRVGASQPFQDTWLNGTVSWIALYNRSLTPFEYELARLGIFFSDNLLYFIEPISIYLFNQSLAFNDVHLVKSDIKIVLELKYASNASYISLVLPQNMSLLLSDDCKCKVLKTYYLADNLLRVQVLDLDNPYFLIIPDFERNIVAIAVLDPLP